MGKSGGNKRSLPDEVTLMDVYNLSCHYADWTEQNRWTRLNNMLIVGSIFTLAWATIYTSSGTPLSLARRVVLTAICIPGILCGYWWSRLGHRTSKYLNAYRDQILQIEKELKNRLQDRREDVELPFTLIEPIAQEVGKTEKHTSSWWLVTNVPFMFAVLFAVLLCVSWKELFIDIVMYLVQLGARP